MKKVNPLYSWLTGLFLTLPFIIMNFIVALRIEPAYSFIGSFPVLRNSPFLPLLLLLLFPVGAFLALRPMLGKEQGSKRKLYPVNLVVAVTLLMIFVIIFYALVEEMYRCTVLDIPNCD